MAPSFRRPRSTALFVIAALIIVAIIYAVTQNQYQLKNLLSYSTRPLWDSNSGPSETIIHYYGDGLRMDDHTCKLHGWTTREGKENVKVLDAVLMSNEVDLLEIRMHELDSVVDYFLIVESNATFTGLPKETFFANNRAKFAKFEHKIVYSFLPGFPLRPGQSPWDVEAHTRNTMTMLIRSHISSFNLQNTPNMIIMSDLDEIPAHHTVDLLRSCDFGASVHLQLRDFLYSFEWFIGLTSWRASAQMWNHNSFYRHSKSGERVLSDAGWHCSYCFKTIPEYIIKMKGFSHADRIAGRVNLLEPKRIQDTICRGKDIFGMLPEAYSIPSSSKRAKRRRICCMCCGIDCSLLWKAVAVVLGLYTLYFGFRAVKWALTPSPTGLEGMPELDVSLGCVGAQYIYNETEVLKTVPLGYRGEHDFNIRGVSVGTVTMIDGDPEATEVEYRITVRSDRKDTLDHVQFIARDDQKDKFTMSQFILDTTHAPSSESKPYCMRFDVNMYIPPNLKKLGVYSDPDVHVSFVPGTKLSNVEYLEIKLEGSSTNNIIRPILDVLAKKVTLKASGGWIVGEATVVNQFQVSTELGDAVANLKITQSIPADPSSPKKASVESIIGSGRADFTVIRRKASKRKIVDMHTSTGGGDMYLTYKDAEYNGQIQLYSKAYTTAGAHKYNLPKEHHEGAEDHIPKWTHFVGNQAGGDELYVTSLGKGWAKLYF